MKQFATDQLKTSWNRKGAKIAKGMVRMTYFALLVHIAVKGARSLLNLNGVVRAERAALRRAFLTEEQLRTVWCGLTAFIRRLLTEGRSEGLSSALLADLHNIVVVGFAVADRREALGLQRRGDFANAIRDVHGGLLLSVECSQCGIGSETVKRAVDVAAGRRMVNDLIMPGAFMPSLAPLQTADLPAKNRPFWELVGPGAILVGLSIGSGELIMWPTMVAKHGHTVIWAAVVGIFLQLWVNFELGRYALATGESVYSAFSRISRGFVFLFLALNIAGSILPGWATASGNALKALVTGEKAGPYDTFLWTWLTLGIVAGLLFGPKLIYTLVEKTETALVAIITLGLIVAAVALGTKETWLQLLQGAVSFGQIPEVVRTSEMDKFFAALVYAGAGGTSNIFLCYYLRDKNLGMGARIPDIVNPLRGTTEKAPSSGFIFPETAENVSRFRVWMTHFRKEQVLIFWGLNTFTILLFIFGGLVMHSKGIGQQEKFDVVTEMADLMAGVMGAPGRVLFLLVAFATLFSTQLAIVDGVARTFSDILHVNFEWARRLPLAKWYVLIAGGYLVVGAMMALVKSIPAFIMLNFNACVGGLAMAIYVPLTLYVNLKHLPKAARPGAASILFMLAASALYITFAVWFTVYMVRSAG